MGNTFLAEKKLSFVMKLFHFVCKKRLLNWLSTVPGGILAAGELVLDVAVGDENSQIWIFQPHRSIS
jgi:hypothetical protein